MTETTHRVGDVVTSEIMSLVNDWITGRTPNYGIVLRDVTTDGVRFKAIDFGARDGLLRGWNAPSIQEGPNLF